MRAGSKFGVTSLTGAFAERVLAELLALREVAEAAKKLLDDWADEDDNGIQVQLDVIEMNLKKAGY